MKPVKHTYYHTAIRMPKRPGAPPLTACQHRVLHLLANCDGTLTDLAKELGISLNTTNHHLALLRKKFKAKSNHTVIRRAFLYGLVEFEEE